MSRTSRSLALLGYVLSAAAIVSPCGAACGAERVQEGGDSLRFGGCGGAYFLADPGEFWVEVEKEDLNRTGRKTFLRAILLGPDRTVLDEQWIPDDGLDKGSGAGPTGRVRLSAQAPCRGVYALNVTASEDRYGEDIAWGLRTNCPRYLIETSRGHRDAPHEEPLVLLSPDKAGDICFMPERGPFSMEITELPDASPVTLFDSTGRELAALTPDAKGAADCAISGDLPRDSVPWRLHLPRFKGVVQIDGVTRWTDDSDFPNVSLWTPHIESWFPLHENRWLLTPYSLTAYAEGGPNRWGLFQVYNNASTPKTLDLSLEFPEESWPVQLSSQRVTLQPAETAPVAVTYEVPETGDSWQCRVRVTPEDSPGFSTWSTLSLRRGKAPAAEPLHIPLVLKPYRHEDEQFGYLPDYPLANQVYFDLKNRPFILSETSLLRQVRNAWKETSAVTQTGGGSASFRTLSSKVAFDGDNDVYALGEVAGSAALLYSRDGGETLRACPIPGRGAFDIEQFSGHNTPDGPPPVVRYTLTQKDPKLIWRRLNDLELFLPEKEADGAVSIGEPVLISKKCIGFSAHSGIPSSVVSREGKVHVAWAEATEPDEKAPGVPTFVVTYDRATRTLGQPALVGYGPPANDVHNTPCITMDSRGYLHTLVGTHGRTFKYARSRQPNDAGAGWTDPEDLGPGLRQTYVGLVCDPNDVLHVAFRLWRDDRAYFPAGLYATLAHMSKRPGDAWSEARPLVVSPFSEYSVFYHRLTIDRSGDLFLSYDYWSTFWFYRTDHFGGRRAMMMSPDGGDTWRLAATLPSPP